VCSSACGKQLVNLPRQALLLPAISDLQQRIEKSASASQQKEMKDSQRKMFLI
jgi:hypothetical protein